MATFVLGDTHFGNKHIMYEEARQGFGNIDNHDATIKDRIVTTCGKGDTLFLMGDIVEYPDRLWLLKEICEKVGTVNIVLGNHDGLYNGGDHPTTKQLFECGVNEVYGMFRYRAATLTHVPRHASGWHRFEKVNVHGHFHEGGYFGDQYLNVAGNVRNFWPLNLDEWLDTNDIHRAN